MRFIMTPGGLPQRSAMAYVIKRYSNRKLYDTQESRYVTLEEIEEMIRAGKEISVVDAASGEDLTAVTLTQIILENERNHRGGLPIGFLHQLIKHRSEEHTSELQSQSNLVCRLLLEKKKKTVQI